MIGKFVSFCLELGITKPADVTVDDVRLFILRLQDRNTSVSIYDYYKRVKRFFNWSVEEDILRVSPMEKIRPPEVEQEIIVPFKPEHIRFMLKLCDSATFSSLSLCN
jgi:site-specific recombinase XerD